MGWGVLTPVSRASCPITTESASCAPLPHSSPLQIPTPPLTSDRPVQLLLPSWSHRALGFTSPALPCVLLHRGAPHPLPGPIPGTSSPGIWLPQPGSAATSLSPGCGMGGFSSCQAPSLAERSGGEGCWLGYFLTGENPDSRACSPSHTMPVRLSLPWTRIGCTPQYPVAEAGVPEGL